jgi:hypothetical protein
MHVGQGCKQPLPLLSADPLVPPFPPLLCLPSVLRYVLIFGSVSCTMGLAVGVLSFHFDLLLWDCPGRESP